MTSDIASIVERARMAAQTAPTEGGGTERARLEKIAQEFESMLLVQVLRSMRTAGAWEDEAERDTLGAESLFETLDVELASHLARENGLGLAKELLTSFDRRYPTVAAAAGGPPVALAAGDPPKVQEPVDGSVTSPFGWRADPFTGARKWHRGIDLKAAYGEDVQAAGDGRVVYSGDQGGYGTTVVLEHANGTRTRYAHLSVALVENGETVSSGQAIGRAGRSGRATGTHVHFELMGADGRHVDPTVALARHGGQVGGD